MNYEYDEGVGWVGTQEIGDGYEEYLISKEEYKLNVNFVKE